MYVRDIHVSLQRRRRSRRECGVPFGARARHLTPTQPSSAASVATILSCDKKHPRKTRPTQSLLFSLQNILYMYNHKDDVHKTASRACKLSPLPLGRAAVKIRLKDGKGRRPGVFRSFVKNDNAIASAAATQRKRNITVFFFFVWRAPFASKIWLGARGTG